MPRPRSRACGADARSLHATRVEPESAARADRRRDRDRARLAGQVVQAQDVLFQIVDPKGLWVEALVYGEIDPATIAEATAAAAGGPDADAASSRASAARCSSRPASCSSPSWTRRLDLSVGQPVTVIAKSGAPVDGAHPAARAVVRSANGEAIVWRHTDPERFEPRPVRTEPLRCDARDRRRPASAEGERIVVRGAELINQIR